MNTEQQNNLIKALAQAIFDRDEAREAAVNLREDMRIHIGEGPCRFPWEPEDNS